MRLRVIDESKINPNKYVSRDMLAPARLWYVLASIIAALLLNFMPLQAFALTIRPDFAALVILFWCINQPQRMSMSLAFCIGLMMDVHNAGILGHHALAYCVLVYFASILRRRLKIFNVIQQSPQIGVILLVMQSIIVLTVLLTGSDLPDWQFFLSSLTGALLWPIMAFLLSIPLKSDTDSDTL